MTVKIFNGLNKLNKREKMLFIFIGALILIWSAYGAIIEPLHNRWNRLDNDVEIAKIGLKKAAKILRQKEGITRQYNESLSRFLARGSDEEEMALVLNEIEAQARGSLIRIVNMKPRRVVKDESYRTFYVDLDIEANMRNILQFIKKLKESKFCLRVEQLTLNSRASEPSVLSGALTVSRFSIEN